MSFHLMREMFESLMKGSKGRRVCGCVCGSGAALLSLPAMFSVLRLCRLQSWRSVSQSWRLQLAQDQTNRCTFFTENTAALINTQKCSSSFTKQPCKSVLGVVCWEGLYLRLAVFPFTGTFEHWSTRSQFDGKMERSRMSLLRSLCLVSLEK